MKIVREEEIQFQYVRMGGSHMRGKMPEEQLPDSFECRHALRKSEESMHHDAPALFPMNRPACVDKAEVLSQ